MADRTRNEDEKRTWLQMAASWLRMIRQPQPSAHENFDAQESEMGTGQQKSKSSH
jgi:hypothetical protein